MTGILLAFSLIGTSTFKVLLFFESVMVSTHDRRFAAMETLIRYLASGALLIFLLVREVIVQWQFGVSIVLLLFSGVWQIFFYRTAD